MRRPAHGAFGTQNQRSVEVAARRCPSMSAPPATGGLLQRPHQPAIFRAGAREAFCLLVGAVDPIIADQSIRRREPRLQPSHRTKRAEAAASAPLTTGPGNRKKNKVTTAVTNTTPLTSVVIGRSKLPTGSSK